MTPEVAKTFTFIEVQNEPQTYIRLDVEPYKDIIYKYLNLTLTEPAEPGGNLGINFQYQVVSSPYKKEDIDVKELEKAIGTVTINLLQWVNDNNKIQENIK